MKIAFYGSSLVSSYWNGAATYYRGIIKALAGLGYEVTFYEPDVYDRQSHRDIDPPDWCKVVVYPGTLDALADVAARASEADVVVKASGVGFEDEAIMRAILAHARRDAITVFWDVDAPATLAEMTEQPDHYLRETLRQVDMVLTYGGGDPVIDAYRGFGIAPCHPIYNALDPDTHHPVEPDPRFACDLAFLGNRLPDREARVEAFFLDVAQRLPEMDFLLGGSGWADKPMAENIRLIGHVGTGDHNAFNVTPRAVLNISRDSMARMGFSPATRVFEAAGAGACIITDAWVGIETFLEPGAEILVAHDADEVVTHLTSLTPQRAAEIGAAARRRMLAEHTYAHRAREADALFRSFARRSVTEAAE